MSILTSQAVTNRIGGDGNQGVYAESSTPLHYLGEKLEFKDGRSFRYCKASGATIGAGHLVAQDQSATSLVETDGVIIAAAGRFSISAGSTAIQITKASITKNQFAGAFFMITDDDGEGHQYKVKSNSATGFTTSGKVDFDFFDPLVVAVTTDSDIAIVGGLYNEVMSCTQNTDEIPVGVATRAVTADYYFWAQSAGIACVLADASGGAIALGDKLTVSDSVAGAAQLQDAYTEAAIGSACFAPDDTGHVGVHLYGLTA